MMKKLLLVLFVAFSGFSMTAQEISTDQWALVSKKTADWCPFCGQWGWTFKENILADQEGKPVLVWAMHHSGNLATPTSQAMAANFPASGQPVFFLNNDNMNVSSSNGAAKREELNVILETINTFAAFGGVGSEAIFDGNKIDVSSRAQFFVDLEGGEYWLASYLVQHELVAFQSSQGNNAVHTNMLLETFNDGEFFGVEISNGSAISADQEFFSTGILDFTGETDIPDFTENYSVATILWSVVDNKFTPFNINVQPIIGATSTKDVLQDIDVAAFHTGDNGINVNINSAETMKNTSIALFDINGRIVTTLSNQTIREGANEIRLETNELTLGTYIVQIVSPQGQKSIKVSVR